MNLLMLVILCVGQITVSDSLPPPVKYPIDVNVMTDAQFFQWATEFNKLQEAGLEKRREQMTEPQYVSGTETRAEHTWSGSDNRTYNRGGDYYGSHNGHSTTYERRWLNPLYTGPGPLVIVNPFCKP